MNAKETAKYLIEENFSVERYEQGIQARRRERLAFWKQENVPQAIIDSEQKLIDFGDEVIRIMKNEPTH